MRLEMGKTGKFEVKPFIRFLEENEDLFEGFPKFNLGWRLGLGGKKVLEDGFQRKDLVNAKEFRPQRQVRNRPGQGYRLAALEQAQGRQCKQGVPQASRG
jgi:hypothetical protein